ncbi:MAG: RES family NAD+ phosphorylase [Caldilineaceae bacterium SB0668_bin_21]|nr:RES family NAD+ phosphorylase [Caldilineaceae bacterium SB0668_bin_21]
MAARFKMSKEDKFVCVYCFKDPGLSNFIRKRAVSDKCSFCCSRSQEFIAASIDDVSAYFLKCLFQEYDLAVSQLFQEGGWIGTFWSSEELAIDEINLEFPGGNQDSLLPYLFGEYFDQDWCEEDAYGPNPQDRVYLSWNYFRKVIMHERRFFFLGNGRETHVPEGYGPGEILHMISEYAQQIGLFTEVPSGTHLLRARREGCKRVLKEPQELGPPPVNKAIQSNRMSPAGIPMFYGCDDEETALKETASKPGFYAIGRFETRRPATLLDLSAIPSIPSLFDAIPDCTEISPRRMLIFLDHVSREISRPIERSEKEHVEYVPTQVVTEFVRDHVKWKGSRVDGIKYVSSVHPCHASYVLFAGQGNICSTPESEFSEDVWLKLIDTKHTWSNGK